MKPQLDTWVKQLYEVNPDWDGSKHKRDAGKFSSTGGMGGGGNVEKGALASTPSQFYGAIVAKAGKVMMGKENAEKVAPDEARKDNTLRAGNELEQEARDWERRGDRSTHVEKAHGAYVSAAHVYVRAARNIAGERSKASAALKNARRVKELSDATRED